MNTQITLNLSLPQFLVIEELLSLVKLGGANIFELEISKLMRDLDSSNLTDSLTFAGISTYGTVNVCAVSSDRDGMVLLLEED